MQVALDNDKVVALLNRILEQELAGVVRYTHYSFLVFGFGRIPIVAWLREQATESLTHAQQAGEMITHLGAYPSLTIGPLLDSHQTDIGTILRESLEVRGAGARPLQGAAGPGGEPLGDAGGVCPANDPRRGDARRRGRQDAPPPRRGRRLPPLSRAGLITDSRSAEPVQFAAVQPAAPRLPRLHQQRLRPVDPDRRAADVARAAGGEEQHQFGDVLGAAGAAAGQRNPPAGYSAGTSAASVSRASVLSPISVSMAPGQTTFTRMPCLPSSTAAIWPSASCAALLHA